MGKNTWVLILALIVTAGCSGGGGGGFAAPAAPTVDPVPDPEFVALQSADVFYLQEGELLQSRLGVMVGTGYIPSATGIQLTPENECLYVFLDNAKVPTYKITADGLFLELEEGEYQPLTNTPVTEIVWQDIISVCRLKAVGESSMLAIGDFYGAGQEYFEPVGELRVVYLEGGYLNVYGRVRTAAESVIDATYDICIRLEPYEEKYHILDEGTIHMVNVDDPTDNASLNSHGLDISNNYLLGWFNYRHRFQGETLGRVEEHIATTGFYAQIKCDLVTVTPAE